MGRNSMDSLLEPATPGQLHSAIRFTQATSDIFCLLPGKPDFQNDSGAADTAIRNDNWSGTATFDTLPV